MAVWWTITYKHQAPLLLVFVIYILLLDCCCAFQSSLSSPYELSVHRMFPDPVKGMMFRPPSKYEGVLSRRHLASKSDNIPALTFVNDNKSYLLKSYGYLYYANVSVGTPAKTYLVALDIESNYFWLPCDCISCSSETSNGDKIDINIYDLGSSSTGTKAPCNSSLCDQNTNCSTSNGCRYESTYSPITSSSGYLVEDVLHLVTDDSKKKISKITFGNQTGAFLTGNAPNGVFGLGPGKSSIPSILSSQKLIADSFSMCFSSVGTSGISFGDNGRSSKQGQTPFSLITTGKTDSSYNVDITQLSIGTKTKHIVDTRATFRTRSYLTSLMDPLYTIVTESIDSQIIAKKIEPSPNSTLEYCYSLRLCSSDITVPSLIITFKGGDQYKIARLGEKFESLGHCFYCLTIIKSDTINAIGSNFLSGHHIVFDRENKELRWEESNCSQPLPTATSTPSTTDTKHTKDNSIPSVSPTSTTASFGLFNSLTLVLFISLFLSC